MTLTTDITLTKEVRFSELTIGSGATVTITDTLRCSELNISSDSNLTIEQDAWLINVYADAQ